jgi:ankyrin repeat protein
VFRTEAGFELYCISATGRVDADSKDKNSRKTPLSWAAYNGDEAVVRLLLETGKVNADSENCDNETPLSLAACNGHDAVVQLLLATGKINADWKVNNPNYPWQTPLSLAAQNGHVAVVKLLLATGKVDINSKDESGLTPLSRAVENGRMAAIQQLLDKGAQLELKDNTGQTLLSIAARRSNKSVNNQSVSKLRVFWS